VRTVPIIAAIAMLLGGEAVAQTAPPVISLPPVEAIGASPLIGSGARPRPWAASVACASRSGADHSGNSRERM
jgi:hypothetical protein